MPGKWKILRSQLVFNHRWCKVRQDAVQLPNGAIVDDYFLNVRPDIVLVLPITIDREIVFVRQYRHGVQEILLELPAGTCDVSQESPMNAAIRELREETGYLATELTPLGVMYDNPVKDTNRVHLFLAEGLQQRVAQNLDVTEEIEVVLIPQEQVRERIATGEICVAGTIAALCLGLAGKGG